jgi:hypothetical protein
MRQARKSVTHDSRLGSKRSSRTAAAVPLKLEENHSARKLHAKILARILQGY